MKKYFYSTAMMFAMTVAALCFTACGGSDDDDNDEINVDGTSSSALVGTWDVVSHETAEWDWYADTYKPYTEYPDDEYWVFTDKKVTIYAQDDLFDGKATNYVYNAAKKTLSIGAGTVTYKVLELTSTSMKLESVAGAIEVSVGDNDYDYPDTYVFKKR